MALRDGQLHLQERLHASAERVRELERAITYLAREASAVLGMTGMREAIGNTNIHCLQRRIDEALRALPPSTGEKVAQVKANEK